MPSSDYMALESAGRWQQGATHTGRNPRPCLLFGHENTQSDMRNDERKANDSADI